MANTKKTTTAKKKSTFKAVTLRSKNDQLSFMKKHLGEHLERYKQCSSQISERCKRNHGMFLKDGQERNFYKSKHDEYDGYFPICKDCLAEIANNEFGELSRKGLAKVCATLNIPYMQKAYEGALEARGKSLGVYMRGIYLNHSDLRFIDSDNDIVHFQIEVENDYDTKDVVVDDELYLKWGSYHSKEDILSLEYNYIKLENAYQIEGVVEQEYLMIACFAKLEMDQLRANGKNTDKAFKQYSDALGKLQINPNQQTKDSDKHKRLGNIAELIEQGEPIVEEDPAFTDVDGMTWYISNFFSQIFAVFGKSKVTSDRPEKSGDE